MRRNLEGTPSGRANPARRVLRDALAVVAAFALIWGGVPTAAAGAEVSTAEVGISPTTLVGFNPSNLMSDALFYDGAAMTTSQIQAFLNQRIGTCTNGRCLNVSTASFSTRGAVVSERTGNQVCAPVTGGTMAVAEAIYRLQVACGISAKVILVTLQKEQGLISGSVARAPTDWSLRAAMGASCPDTSPCDPAFAGLGPQLVKGVTQLKTYRAGAFARQPGVHFIGYHPNAACGGTSLAIANYATAALYNYTPYQPNSAALNAGYGTGDGCSSYGNRNFVNYYTDWFGSTQRDAAAEIEREYQAQGGAGTLGLPITGVVALERNGGGYGRAYANGSIYWTVALGAKTVAAGAVRDYYFAHGGADGSVGWPALNLQSIVTPSRTAHGQLFTGGSVYSSEVGTFIVREPLRTGYFRHAGAAGRLGWPTGDQVCAGGVCSQTFEGGLVVSSPHGAFAVADPVRGPFVAAGAASGSWGVPVMDVVALPYHGGGFGQAFAQGSVYFRGDGVARFVSGAVKDRYFALGGAAGRLGYPVGDQACDGQGCRQEFQFGWILTDSSGRAREGAPAIDAAYAALGGVGGVLGARTAPLVYYAFNGGGLAEGFAGGAIFYKPSAGAHAVLGAIRASYFAAGGAAGRFGWPTGDQVCAGGVCSQTFEGGLLTAPQ